MKYIFLLATLVIQFLSVLTLKLLDNISLIVGIFCGCIIIGGFIMFSKKGRSSQLKNIGWGLFYGSLTSLVVIMLFMLWLSFNFPK